VEKKRREERRRGRREMGGNKYSARMRDLPFWLKGIVLFIESKREQ
jgi:hypothetical protein